MSLINNNYESFCFISASLKSDGEGGQIFKKSDAEEFEAVLRTDKSVETEIAEKPEKNVTYTVTTHRDIQLKFNDLIKRKSDGKIFRITSDSQCPPKTARLDMRQVTAEERA